MVVEEAPSEEKENMWEEETERELDAFLHMLVKSICKSMQTTRLCVAYMACLRYGAIALLKPKRMIGFWVLWFCLQVLIVDATCLVLSFCLYSH